MLPEQRKITDKGATMRLGAYPCALRHGSLARRAYGRPKISERHRHRYELNNDFRGVLQKNGMVVTGEYWRALGAPRRRGAGLPPGLSPTTKLGEIVEIPGHPWFVATQFHPEFKSRPVRPHPLFREFIKAAKRQKRDR